MASVLNFYTTQDKYKTNAQIVFRALKFGICENEFFNLVLKINKNDKNS